MNGPLWEYYKEIGNRYFRDKNYKEAILNYKKAIDVNNKIDVLYSNKGTCEKCLKNYREALIDYKTAVELNPSNAKNLHRLASVHLILGNLPDALKIQRNAILLQPNELSYKDQLKSIEELLEEDHKMLENIKKGELKLVESQCDSLMDKYPDLLYLKKIKIKLLMENFRYEEAIKYIIDLITTQKHHDLDLAYYLIIIFYYDGNYAKAEELINIMKKEGIYDERYNDLLYKIKNIESIKEKANNIFKQNKYEEALKEYTEILKFDPNNRKFNSIILANRASCYQKLNKNLDALKDLNLSLKINPNYNRGYIKRGNVFLQLNKYKEAIEDFFKAKNTEANATSLLVQHLENTNKKINDLEIDLNMEKARNQKLFQEIISLKNLVNTKDYLLNDKTEQIDDLRKSIKHFDKTEYSNKDKLLELMEKLQIKEEKLKNVENELVNLKLRYPFELKEGERLMSIIIMSEDQKIHTSFFCKNTDKFNKLENILYDKYPLYSEEENYFIANGQKVNKYRSLEYNNIKDGDIITLYPFEFNNEFGPQSYYNDSQQNQNQNQNQNGTNKLEYSLEKLILK